MDFICRTSRRPIGLFPICDAFAGRQPITDERPDALSFGLLGDFSARVCVLFASGCTDLKPIQAQIDDLKSQVTKLSSDQASIKSRADGGAGAAQSAAAAAQRAQASADSAGAAAKTNAQAIEAINVKIDRMFKKSVSK
jgi:outer membrane murein-binding lipoprotein Lpp